MQTRIAIIGGGIAGLTAAIALRRFRPDIDVEIFEASDELRSVGAGLGMGANAVLAFEQLSIERQVVGAATVLERFRILDRRGRTITEVDNLVLNQAYRTVSNFAVHRADLQRVLLAHAGAVRLGKRAVRHQADGDGVTITFADGTTARADYLIAADGIHSAVRQALAPSVAIRFAGYTCWRGVTTGVPPGFAHTVASETWSRGRRFGIVPLPGGRIYWFACVNAPRAGDERLAQFTRDDLLALFDGFHAPITDVLRLTDPSAILWNDIIDFAPIRRFVYGRVLLLGDAAHATTPNMGQGAGQAIEGAAVLGRVLRDAESIESGFAAFETRRVPRTAAIVNRSWQIGRVAQIGNPVLSAVRDFAFRQMPASAGRRQLEAILAVDFT